MLSEKQIKIIKEAILKYDKYQLIVSLEELSELQKEICKTLRGKSNINTIIEELSDVIIICETIKQYFKINNSYIKHMITFKLNKLKKIIDENNSYT